MSDAPPITAPEPEAIFCLSRNGTCPMPAYCTPSLCVHRENRMANHPLEESGHAAVSQRPTED